MPDRSRWKRILLLDLCIVLLALLAAPLSSWMLRALPNCFVAELGYLCPACGSTRCVQALSRGQLSLAFSLHPMLCVSLVYLAAVLLFLHLQVFCPKPWSRRIFAGLTHWKTISLWGICYGLFGLLRNF